MDCVNSSSSSNTPLASQQQQQQQQQQQLHQQLQQQQFCLRWHNHQASLLSTLPLLLDQSHLTDVTLSAEGKICRAHRVVLSACSTFFSDLFRNLETNFYPVIVIPGASFTAVVALLTFMYSGEVNVYEEQIPTLLKLAETLGIKGLSEFQPNNISKECKTEASNNNNNNNNINNTCKEIGSPFSSPSKIPSPLENFLMKTFQFPSNILNQPLNFSQSSLNETQEFLNKCQQLNLNQSIKENNDGLMLDKRNSLKRSNSCERKLKENLKRIDKIAENLRASSNKSCLDVLAPKIPINMVHSTNPLMLKSPFPRLPNHFMPPEELIKFNKSLGFVDQQQQPVSSFSSPEGMSSTDSLPVDKTLTNSHQKSTNAKLYATCFICHKQLSNQYNLRVHLETHQNVRYACNVCSHISRSKDALRKHVSYRHPGVPSPCENDSRRKRSKTINTHHSQPFNLMKTDNSKNDLLTTSNQSCVFLHNQFGTPTFSTSSTGMVETSTAVSTKSLITSTCSGNSNIIPVTTSSTVNSPISIDTTSSEISNNTNTGNDLKESSNFE